MPLAQCKACGDTVRIPETKSPIIQTLESLQPNLQPEPVRYHIIQGSHYCLECGNEILYGAIGPPPRPTAPAGHYGPCDDISPGQENAIRTMEG